jgi:hypothetical protein
MAFISQENKKEMTPAIKAVLKKFGMKGTIGVRHHSTLIVNIKSGDIDMLAANKRAALDNPKNDMYDKYDVERLNYILARTHIDVNEHWVDSNFDSQIAIDFVNELIAAMKGPSFFNHTDSMTDYFHRSHYIDINIGGWDKPYQFNGVAETFEPAVVTVHPDVVVKVPEVVATPAPKVVATPVKTATIYKFPEMPAGSLVH